LADLKGFSKLDTLNLTGTRVSDTAVKNLQKSLPETIIKRK